jgi:hypothetical protein
VRFIAITVLVLVQALPACLNTVDDEVDYPGALSPGYLRLDQFPAGIDGISGLGPYCRRVHDCGCLLLDPEDVQGCRENVALLDEDTCRSMLERAVPECLP